MTSTRSDLTRCAALILALTISIFHAGPAHAWGFTIHRIINRNAVDNLPSDFAAFGQWATDLEALATAADERKDSVPGENIRHYIDIDDYPEFAAGTLPHDFAGMMSRYGRSRVEDNGIVPWAIDEEYHRLVERFQAGDWAGAVETAADIGHYVGDLHQPLHLTMNFDGQLTGQGGLHSRFETRMTGRHVGAFQSLQGPAVFLEDPLETAFGWIDRHYAGVQWILNADLTAKSAAGGSTSSDVYYDTLWEELGQVTVYWTGIASKDIASVWYTAWIDAGSPALPGTIPVESTTWGRIKSLFQENDRPGHDLRTRAPDR